MNGKDKKFVRLEVLKVHESLIRHKNNSIAHDKIFPVVFVFLIVFIIFIVLAEKTESHAPLILDSSEWKEVCVENVTKSIPNIDYIENCCKKQGTFYFCTSQNNNPDDFEIMEIGHKIINISLCISTPMEINKTDCKELGLRKVIS